ncbi:MAG TPA: hypothetical protein PK760_02545, partial [Flavobacteriales bacterium]|nr:hypothetical protein [Flavobacteriales bacterium]
QPANNVVPLVAQEGALPKQERRPQEQNVPLEERKQERELPLQDAPAPIAQEQPEQQGQPVQQPETLVPNEPAPAVASVAAPTKRVQETTNTLGEALAAKLRERVLNKPAGDTSPLAGDDAVAAVNEGLKVVAGDGAGLVIPRDAKGHGRGFNLRLGRNLAISASR